jgi:hypothetical protein
VKVVERLDVFAKGAFPSSPEWARVGRDVDARHQGDRLAPFAQPGRVQIAVLFETGGTITPCVEEGAGMRDLHDT